MKWMLMPLRRYAEFSGRSRRREYWMFLLFQLLVYIAAAVLLVLLGGGAMLVGGDGESLGAAGIGAMIVAILYGLFSLAMIIPSIAVGVRRLHDTNRRGWWLFAPIAPYVAMFLAAALAANAPDLAVVTVGISIVAVFSVLGLGVTLLVFLLLDGTRGPNRFGEDPKGVDHSEVFA